MELTFTCYTVAAAFRASTKPPRKPVLSLKAWRFRVVITQPLFTTILEELGYNNPEHPSRDLQDLFRDTVDAHVVGPKGLKLWRIGIQDEGLGLGGLGVLSLGGME